MARIFTAPARRYSFRGPGSRWSRPLAPNKWAATKMRSGLDLMAVWFVISRSAVRIRGSAPYISIT